VCWYHQGAVVDARTMSLNAFSCQVRVIHWRWCGRSPYALSIHLGILVTGRLVLLALPPHGFPPCPVFGFLFGSKFSAYICPPRLSKPGAPVTESASRHTIAVQDIPSGLVTALAIA
jgi:hypothetical protein